MKSFLTPGRIGFHFFNYLFLAVLAVFCVFPFFHVMALSFSSSTAAAAGAVVLWPVDFTLQSYDFILGKVEFAHAFLVTIERVALGTAINLLMTLLVAYPLSKSKEAFKFRSTYAWYFVFTILFSGGLIPWYMVVKSTGLIDSIWALVLPEAVPVFNVILLLNFFRDLPSELEESVFIDGAGYWKSLWKIYVPLSLPALATITLFTVVNHWNAWFDGLILMNSPEKYPLSSYLRTVLSQLKLTSLTLEEYRNLMEVSDRTAKAAQIILGSLPILVVYPFLQRFFVKGLVLGGVKE